MSDESIRHLIRSHPQDPAAPDRPHHPVAIDPAEALQLLGSVSLGRIVFTQHALPAIRPVNHIVVDGDVIVRTHQGAALAAHIHGGSAPDAVVTYEADAIDPATHLGWSVVATGYARLVTDPAELDDYRRRLQPWVDQVMDLAVRIHPEVITGLRLR